MEITIDLDNNRTAPIGELIKQGKETAGLTVSDLSQELQIPVKYIKALEEEDYGVFGAKLYAKSFLIKILERLKIEKSENILGLFELSWKESLCLSKDSRLKQKDGFVFTPGRLSLLGCGLFFLFLFFFFGLRISRTILPPKLDLIEPKDRMLLTNPKLNIKGFAQKESRVSVNGREINTDNKGGFDTYINLRPGLNTLEFYAESRFGKIKKVVRYVVLK